MSEPEKCLSVGKNFSRREWLMAILILLMMQAGALTASHAFMSSQDVLNYISFASTIASLVLAVLAIVYGFYQSESQKRVGDGIEVHLSRIRQATDGMANVSQELTNNSKEMMALGESLPALNEMISSTQKMLTRLDENIINISQEQSRVFSAVSEIRQAQPHVQQQTSDSDVQNQAAENVVFNGPNIAMRYTVLGLSVVFKDNEDKVFARPVFVDSLAGIMASHHPKLRASAGEWSAAIYTAVMVLRSIGVLRGDTFKVTSGDTQKLALASGRYELLKRSAQETTAATDEYQALFRKLEEDLVGVPLNK